MRNVAVGDLVEISWVDSFGTDGWISRDVSHVGTGSCTTVAYVLDINDGWITTTGTYSDTNTIYGFLKIPVVAISKVSVLRKNRMK